MREECSDVCQRVTESRRSLEADFGGRRPEAECVIQCSRRAASHLSGATYDYERVLEVAGRTEQTALQTTSSNDSKRSKPPLPGGSGRRPSQMGACPVHNRGRVSMKCFFQHVTYRQVIPTRVSPLRLKRLPSVDPGSSAAIEPAVTDRLCRTDSRSLDEPARTRGSAAEGSQHIPYPRTALTQSV